MIEQNQIEGVIRREEVIEFDYPSSADGQPQRRQFSPWRLEKDGTVLFGFDHARDTFRRYTLERMTNVEINFAESFVRPAT